MTYVRNMIVVVGAFIAACTTSTTPNDVGGETHFLHACEGTGTCGPGLECICGVCTKPCTSDNTCKDQSEAATCEAAGTPNGACLNPQASLACDVACTTGANCDDLGSGYTCESGSCRKLSVSGMDSTTPLDPFPVDLACMDGDVDGGVPHVSRLMVRQSPALCATGQAVLAREGVELIGADSELPFFELTATDAYWFSWRDLKMVRAELGTGRSWSFNENRLDITAIAIDGCQIVAGGRDRADVLGARLDGSDPRVLGLGEETGSSGPTQILLDATHAYVSQATALQRVPRAGGTIETLDTRAQGVFGPDLILLGDRALWIAYPSNNFLLPHLTSFPKAGGAPAVFGPTLPSNPAAIATDGTHVYVALNGTSDSLGNYNNDGAIVRMTMAGDQLETVSMVGSPVLSVAVDGTHVYWLRLDARNGDPWRASVWRAAKSSPQIATQVADDAWTFRIDDTHVYWNQPCTAGSTTDSFLVRIAKSALD